MTAVAFAGLGIAPVVGRDYHEPVFVKAFFAIVDGFPNAAHLSVHHLNGLMKLFAIAVLVTHIVGIFEVNPRHVGAVVVDVCGRFVHNFLIDFMNILALLIVFEMHSIEFESIK
ncbi:hypothetical protein D3C87_1678120 [compost metagenome]